jgi:hypothetical protein
MNKVLFSIMGGLFLVVLIAQNLIYVGVPVRISAWLLLAAAFVQMWLCRHKIVSWGRTFYSDAEIRTMAVIILVTIIFHGIVPTQQGLQWYYGKGYPDYPNYVQLAEFLKEEPYGTGEREIGLRPWLINPASWLKKERIGQSIITAEISVWSCTDGKGGYAATVIFFLTLLAVCLYVLLRGTGIDRFMAGSGALLAALLPAITRLSLDNFLSHVSILFVFPFLASLLRHEILPARSLTLFFSLTLAYLVAAYSEIAPIGFCTVVLGLMFVRQEKFRTKRLMLMSAILLVAFVNPYYLRNLIAFLGEQYSLAANATFLDNMMPNVLTLRGWSELIFGVLASSRLALIFDICTILVGILLLAGVILLSRRDRLIFGATLLPSVLLVLYLATRTPFSYYALAKITLTILPLMIGLAFVALARVAGKRQTHPDGIVRKLFSAFIVVAAAAGSVRYYSEVLDNRGLLRTFREPHFLEICRELEGIKNKRVFVFWNDPLLSPWLCYHARHNDVYVDGHFISDSSFSRRAPFSKVPDLASIDFEVTPDRIVDLRGCGTSRTPLTSP